MASFTDVTLGQMDEVLQKDKGWERSIHNPGRANSEYVYNFPLSNPQGTVVKVYSSINPQGCRRKGKDAIRVCAVRTTSTGVRGYIKGKRVHRVEGWRDNLRARVKKVIADARERNERESSFGNRSPVINQRPNRQPTQERRRGAGGTVWRGPRNDAEKDLADYLESDQVPADGFLRSLAQQWNRKGELSPRQWNAGISAMDTLLGRRANTNQNSETPTIRIKARPNSNPNSRFRGPQNEAEQAFADALDDYSGQDNFLGSLAAQQSQRGGLTGRQWESGMRAHQQAQNRRNRSGNRNLARKPKDEVSKGSFGRRGELVEIKVDRSPF